MRRAWRILHRWIGVSFGCLLLAAGITGSLLVIARPLDAAMHPELFRSSGHVRAELQPLVLRLRAEFGDAAAFNIRLPPRPLESLHVAISGPWSGTVYFDAASGRELGRRASRQGFVNVLFDFHSTLFAGDTGRALLAGAALGYCAMLLSGLVLWWPSHWLRAFSVRTDSGRNIALMDLHRAAGSTLGLLVLLSVASGAYMAWRPLSAWVTSMAGEASAPILPATAPIRRGLAAVPVDTAVQRASEHWPEGIVSVVHVPAGSLAATRVRVRLPDDPHPIGMSTIRLDPLDGRVSAARRWSELDTGSRAFRIIYPLHIGDLFGWATVISTLIGGVALTAFGITGLWLLGQRRRFSARLNQRT